MPTKFEQKDFETNKVALLMFSVRHSTEYAASSFNWKMFIQITTVRKDSSGS